MSNGDNDDDDYDYCIEIMIVKADRKERMKT